MADCFLSPSQIEMSHVRRNLGRQLLVGHAQAIFTSVARQKHQWTHAIRGFVSPPAITNVRSSVERDLSVNANSPAPVASLLLRCSTDVQVSAVCLTGR